MSRLILDSGVGSREQVVDLYFPDEKEIADRILAAGGSLDDVMDDIVECDLQKVVAKALGAAIKRQREHQRRKKLAAQLQDEAVAAEEEAA